MMIYILKIDCSVKTKTQRDTSLRCSPPPFYNLYRFSISRLPTKCLWFEFCCPRATMTPESVSNPAPLIVSPSVQHLSLV